MPILNMDIKGLEVVVAAQLSGDITLCKEIIDGLDIHEINRDSFKLGEGKAGRLVAKVFKFRLLYGGSAYSYANDPDFRKVSTSQTFWQDVIDKYYTKYTGIAQWHKQLILKHKHMDALQFLLEDSIQSLQTILKESRGLSPSSRTTLYRGLEPSLWRLPDFVQSSLSKNQELKPSL